MRRGSTPGTIALLAGLTAALAVGGCGRGPAHGDVEGVVRINGRPARNVFVQFLPDPEKDTAGPRSSGVTDDQGRYRLLCDNERDGAVVGWHRVVLLDLDAKRAAEGQPLPPNASRVPLRFGDAISTPLLREVQPGAQAIDLDVEPR